MRKLLQILIILISSNCLFAQSKGNLPPDGRVFIDSLITSGVDTVGYLNKYEEGVQPNNILNIVKEYDIVMDCTDNYETRYLVNDACVLASKPLVYGAIYKFEGQVAVFNLDEGPSYRCLYPEPPPPGLVPNCQEGGVLGVLAGIIGNIQAAETLKMILGIGKPLIGKLLLYDALNTDFRKLNLKRDSNCPVCGDNPSITELIDYEEFCGISE